MTKIMTDPTVPSHDSQQDFPSQPPQPDQAWPPTAEVGSEGTEPWQTVEFPGVLSPEQIPPQPKHVLPDLAVSGSDINQLEGDLLQLVQDLNQCNDALLSRIAELEEALERSELALQSEVERSQQIQSTQAIQSAGVAAPAPPQQIAQLLSELDTVNDALRRTTIHNEALRADYEAAQQRVAQLERECTLQQQRFTEKSTALQKAEDTCRDLRSRLQRQQRYTLQFKAALEKCLDMANTQQGHPVSPSPQPGAATQPPAIHPHPLAMPKAQQIQPWAASDTAPVKGGQSLEALLQSLKAQGQGPGGVAVAGTPLPTQETAPEKPDSEAESQLWQDLERVMEEPEAISPPAASSQTPFEQPSLRISTESEAAETATFTEPSPWGAPLEVAAPETMASESPQEILTESPFPSEANIYQEAPISADPVPAVPQPHSEPTTMDQLSSWPGKAAGLPPSLGKSQGTSPSPLVHPLRPQKKLKSIAAVQLPSFPRRPAKVSS